MRRTEAPKSEIQSVERAVRILGVMAEHPKGLGVSSVADFLGLNVSTVHRLLSTLMVPGLIQQNPETGKYRLGLRLVDLGTIVLESLDLRGEASPFLQSLEQMTHETVHLGVLDEGRVVYIDKVEQPRGIHMYSRIGRRSPVHCTAIGKALVAFLSDSTVHTILQTLGLPRFTPSTICDSEEFREHLRQVRIQGYAFDDEEHELGIRCVAAPVRDHTRSVVAAVSVAAPTARVSQPQLRQFAPLVKETADAISTRLDYQGG